MVAKILDFVKIHHADVFLGIAIICITVISFNLGRISVQSTPGSLAIIPPDQITAVAGKSTGIATAPEPRDERVVASKASSSKLYHFMWCSGAKRIAEKNKLTFANEAAAKAAGYALAGNCQK